MDLAAAIKLSEDSAVYNRAPKNSKMAIAKVPNKLHEIRIGTVNQPVSVANGKKPVDVFVSLLPSDGGTIAGGRINAFDVAVMDAVDAIYEENRTSSGCVMTEAEIFRVLIGKPGANLIPTEKQRRSIQESMLKLSTTVARLEFSQQARLHRLHKEGPVERGGPLVMASWGVDVVNGNLIKTYHVSDRPILYAYAGLFNQIKTFPPRIRNVPVSNTRLLISLRDILLRFIFSISGRGFKNNGLTWDEIFSRMPDKLTRADKARLRSAASAMLGYWEKENLIGGFSFEKKPGDARGKEYKVIIRPPESPKPPKKKDAPELPAALPPVTADPPAGGRSE